MELANLAHSADCGAGRPRIYCKVCQAFICLCTPVRTHIHEQQSGTCSRACFQQWQLQQLTQQVQRLTRVVEHLQKTIQDVLPLIDHDLLSPRKSPTQPNVRRVAQTTNPVVLRRELAKLREGN